MGRWKRRLLGAVVLLGCGNLLRGAVSVSGAAGITASLDTDGGFSIAISDPAWRLAGNIGGQPFNVIPGEGTDRAGAYREIAFDYAAGGSRHASMRVYTEKRAILFTLKYDEQSDNTAPFPAFTAYPANLNRLTYFGMFAIPSFCGIDRDGPWLLFDGQARAALISPAANFLVADTRSVDGAVASGISPRIASLPAGFTHQTLLVLETGINRAFETWGRVLTDLQGKTRPPNDADISLRALGYWTDNGAPYYYRTAPSRTYEETLTGIRDDFRQAGVPLGYVQLDSWFYPKGAAADWSDLTTGIYEYIGAPSLFQPTLGAFQQRLGLPLVTHSRWIDAASPYRAQYQTSGNVVIDRRFWDKIAAYAAGSGVRVYEQDWLGDKAHTDYNLTDAEAFMANMAEAMAARGVNMQYCMAAPRHFLQGSKYSNLTTIRTSQDRFGRDRWTNFLYSSRLAGALGIWPFTDCFLSTEADNLLLATLSAGPVGVADALGKLNRENLLRAVRADGTIVKPDAPIVPLDEVYLRDAKDQTGPMVAATYTDSGAGRAYYVFAYTRGADTVAAFRPAALGMAGTVYVYNYFTGAGRLLRAQDTFSEPMTDGRAYYLAAPVGPSGIALLGDRGHFVGLGKARIPEVRDEGAVQATVIFAAGENERVIQGYAISRPVIHAETGTAGGLTYDSTSQLFEVTVKPGSEGKAVVAISVQDPLCAPIMAVPKRDPWDCYGSGREESQKSKGKGQKSKVPTM